MLYILVDSGVDFTPLFSGPRLIRIRFIWRFSVSVQMYLIFVFIRIFICGFRLRFHLISLSPIYTPTIDAHMICSFFFSFQMPLRSSNLMWNLVYVSSLSVCGIPCLKCKQQTYRIYSSESESKRIVSFYYIAKAALLWVFMCVRFVYGILVCACPCQNNKKKCMTLVPFTCKS